MSMTREEAVERLKQLKRSCRDLAAGMPEEPGWTLYGMALDMALSALRPVSREQVERLTEARVMVPCPGCGGENIVDCYRHNEVWYQCDDCGWQGPSVYSEGFADTEKARLAWNTRAPILSSREMEMLEGMK